MPENETQQTNQSDVDSEENSKSSNSNIEEEYERATLYFQKSTKKSFERWLSRMELDHDIVFESEKRQRHEALINVAMNNEEEFLERLESVMGQM